nr:MAG TPA: hypothetical protein [Caudoviricetes sp.]
MRGQTLHLHSFSFSPSFLMGGASAPPGWSNMPQADAAPHFGGREGAPLMRRQMKTLDRFHPQGAFLGRMPHTRHRCPVRGGHSE